LVGAEHTVRLCGKGRVHVRQGNRMSPSRWLAPLRPARLATSSWRLQRTATLAASLAASLKKEARDRRDSQQGASARSPSPL